MIAIRKHHRAFGWGEFEWLNYGNEHIAAFERTYGDEKIITVHNLSDTNQKVSLQIKKPVSAMTDLLTSKEFIPINENLEIELLPYQYLWLK